MLANDLNPFEAEGTPLRVVDAQIDQLSVGSTASVTFTSTGITAKTGPSFTGELSIVYRVQDGTKDPAREVQSRVTVIVRAAPDAPAQPQATAGDGTANVRWQAPATNNSPILDYTVSWAGDSQTFPAGAAGSYQSITGLTNGQSYSFTVTARNAIGNSAASPGSNTVTPYGTPRAPRSVVIRKGGDAPTTLSMDWNAPSVTGGGAIYYEWRLNGGAWQTTTATSASRANAGAGTWTVDVRAVNNGSGKPGPVDSASVVVNNPPPTVTVRKGPAMGPYSGQYGQCNGTCWFFDVTVENFSGSSVTVAPGCNSTQLSGRYTINLDGNGNGRYIGGWNGNGTPQSFCGDQGWAVVNGIRDNW